MNSLDRSRQQSSASRGRPNDPRRDRIAKRLVDLVLGTVALVLLSPVIALIALAIVVTDGRPILFRQVRPGYRARPFTILKFRTMRAPREGEVWYQTDDRRVTRIGSFLRATSLDELPELINVLRGEMSLVGPRPLLVEYLETYTPEEQRRHDVRPGVTGWAAVNGRHTARFEDRLRYDVWYVDNRSLRLDLRIMAMTLRQVLRREGVSTAQDMSLGFRLPGLGDDAPPAASPDGTQPAGTAPADAEPGP